MKISLARVMGSCFGVERAVEMALKHPDACNLTMLGELVHNPQTVEQLREKGIKMAKGAANIGEIQTRFVMITAHGASDRVKDEVVRRGREIVDATCPLVQHVHKRIKEMVVSGCFPVVIGEERHAEIQGIVGDLAEYLVISSAAEVGRIPASKRKKLGIVSQTTQNANEVEKIVAEIRRRKDVDEIIFANTVCKPTRDRQEAVEELCRQVDIMIVVGGRNSSNTRRLKLLCESMGVKARHVESAKELEADWFAGCLHAGITAGTSTPDAVIHEVHERMTKLAEK